MEGNSSVKWAQDDLTNIPFELINKYIFYNFYVARSLLNGEGDTAKKITHLTLWKTLQNELKESFLNETARDESGANGMGPLSMTWGFGCSAITRGRGHAGCRVEWSAWERADKVWDVGKKSFAEVQRRKGLLEWKLPTCGQRAEAWLRRTAWKAEPMGDLFTARSTQRSSFSSFLLLFKPC